MLTKTSIGFVALSILAATQPAVARLRWLERDERAVLLHPRRFGQEHPAVIDKLSAACPGQVCGNLAGQAITPLLAAQPECSQQDMADAIIDASRQFDAATQQNMIALAKEYRQAEKNTPPDFSTNPPALRNSVFCQKAPKNPELNGLVQAQDPANDPNLFFDPATKATVKKGDQPNTSPFNVASTPAGASSVTAAPTATKVLDTVPSASCVTAVTVTVSGTNPAATGPATTFTVGDPVVSAPAANPTGSSGIGNFGKCSVPQIEFGVGFDGRKETSFQPVDKVSYNHGSAQNSGIITQFICDTLTNSCGADQTAKDTCTNAKAAAAAAPAGTGAQADAFNAAFGIKTNFAAVAAVDNQGKVVPGTGSGNGAPASTAATNSDAAVPTSTAAAPATSAATGSGGIGNFGKCSVPQIEFGAGFDGRKETSFQPADKTSFNHGSAQNIDIISRFICDTLTNSCGADATAKATCTSASAAADAVAAKTGAQADAFNAAFGIKTNFANVTPIDDQGRVVGAASTSSSANGNGNNLVATTVAKNAPTGAAPPAVTTAPATSDNSANLQNFTGALGGVAAPAVTALPNGKFQVAGNAAINTEQSAIIRSCDVQNNKCADAANASGNKNGFTVAACNAQQQQCIAAARSA
ncbi:hypothetical protein LshimejAT787_0802580 [Lyophyllum shimeji]|uniref:Uncharacterized protein n=1 Tax=Lyophyllum shimeji TaxID=47721 RepID=A0A9P3PPS1_LYOSH|nr:hypothetical protein LshimejAT787_0802580 [Lyophyllum shimeji]